MLALPVSWIVVSSEHSELPKDTFIQRCIAAVVFSQRFRIRCFYVQFLEQARKQAAFVCSQRLSKDATAPLRPHPEIPALSS